MKDKPVTDVEAADKILKYLILFEKLSLTKSEIKFLMYLVTRLKKSGFFYLPTQEVLFRDLQVSRPSITNGIAKLVALNVITKKGRFLALSPEFIKKEMKHL